MLILSRREAECVCLGEEVVVTVVAVGNDKVRIGVQAPSGVRILRRELDVADKSAALVSESELMVEPVTLSIIADMPAEPQNGLLDHQGVPLSSQASPRKGVPGPLRALVQKSSTYRRAA